MKYAASVKTGVFCLLVTTSSALPVQAKVFSDIGTTPIDEVELLGVKLVNQEFRTVRQLLWDLGGFRQAKSTLYQKNVDKFFPISQIRDSYYIEFRYNPQGRVTQVKRMFRYATPSYHNRLHPIRTWEVAEEIVSQIGLPTRIKRKSWGAGPSYNSYIWESEQITVTVDREGSDYYGNIYVEYINKVDPYARDNMIPIANRRILN